MICFIDFPSVLAAHSSRVVASRRRSAWLIAAFALLTCPALAGAAASGESRPQQLLRDSRRILFLGDSITAAGQYVAYFDAWLISQRASHMPTIIDGGLPSETVSGLSEDGHAGGAFPRPDLAERLDRVLALAKPDLVIACYGINCAIYEPFDERRFEKYRDGIKHLKSQVEAAGAKLVLVTPPFYDDQRSPKPFSYNQVLDRYSDWLLQQRQDGWLVVDLHGPMTREVNERRAKDATFTFQPDGVHPNDDGHWFIAQQLIRWFGGQTAANAKSPDEMLAAQQVPKEVLKLVEERVRTLRDAYVAAADHKRPGVAAGLPVAEAKAKARELSAKIQALISPSH
jgi:lysophospholipase L1-like esterase